MPPRIVPVIAFAVLFAAGSALIVGREGEAHRKELADARATAGAEPAPIAEPSRNVEVGARTTIPDPVAPAPTPTPEPAPASRPAEPAEAKADPGRAPPAPEVVVKRDPFWGSPKATLVWDLTNPTPEIEAALGEALRETILRFNPEVDGPWLERVDEAAEPLIKSLPDKGAKYRFTILDTDDVNAFSHPGRYVYISRGVFDLVGEDQDHALRFLIAHEMAHVELKHGLACLRHPDMKKTGLGTLAAYYQLILPWGYAEAQDEEADAWAYRRMTELGHTRLEITTLLRKLRGYAQTHGFENRRAEPKRGEDVSLVGRHIGAHPIVRERLKKLAELDQASPKPPAGP